MNEFCIRVPLSFHWGNNPSHKYELSFHSPKYIYLCNQTKYLIAWWHAFRVEHILNSLFFEVLCILLSMKINYELKKNCVNVKMKYFWPLNKLFLTSNKIWPPLNRWGIRICSCIEFIVQYFLLLFGYRPFSFVGLFGVKGFVANGLEIQAGIMSPIHPLFSCVF